MRMYHTKGHCLWVLTARTNNALFRVAIGVVYVKFSDRAMNIWCVEFFFGFCEKKGKANCQNPKIPFLASRLGEGGVTNGPPRGGKKGESGGKWKMREMGDSGDKQAKASSLLFLHCSPISPQVPLCPPPPPHYPHSRRFPPFSPILLHFPSFPPIFRGFPFFLGNSAWNLSGRSVGNFMGLQCF